MAETKAVHGAGAGADSRGPVDARDSSQWSGGGQAPDRDREIVDLQTVDLGDGEWAEFVALHPEATCFHRPEWGRLIAECYGYRPFVVVHRGRSGEIVAGLPVLEVRRPLGGRRWVSLPFSDACGPLVGPRGSARDLALDADGMRGQRRVAELLIRADLDLPGRPAQEVGVTHVLALGTTGSTPRPRSSVRRAVAAAQRAGVLVRSAQRAEDLTDGFYDLHVLTRRRQGVPVQPRRYFRLLWQHMIEPGHGTVLLAEVEGRVVAGAVYLTGGSTVTYKYGASDDRYWSLRPNHAVMARAIEWAAGQGQQWFDFGRTDLDNPGLMRFKESWGAVAHPLRYTSLPPSARGGYSSGGRAQALAAPVIRRAPSAVCRGLGELLYRYAA